MYLEAKGFRSTGTHLMFSIWACEMSTEAEGTDKVIYQY